ncbi:threonine/serine dehydratase [Pseudonocardia alaniniphila]|uniref:Threonine/serine dehydratase n=1 Tax=Pseudonocardia alaniniphila TaxID=75291 RepID=A0ABS9TQS3_9PSEU|nr:threonine/serine dehydratase [Pseudonocardia alaniniphila]MCH6170898.1 threonine/serine dehydratase [Pseudonocardia alaniniphila]
MTLFGRIVDAHRGIRPDIPVTMLVQSTLLSRESGCDVWLKAEHLMPTGSFKVRGSANKLRTLGAAARQSGVITASTGNHGLGVARAGVLAGVGVTVYVPTTATKSKMAAIESLGAELVVVDGSLLDSEKEARRQSELQGKPYVAPSNDLDTMAGQGTLGVELVEQAPDLDAVFMSVGGGGLIGGVGTALKALGSATRVVGVWPKASTSMLDSLNAGRIVETPAAETLSESSAGAVEPGSTAFTVCQEVIDETVTVSEEEIARAMRMVAEGERWIIEGSAGVAVAGMLQSAARYRGKKVAAVLCGRNIELETFLAVMERAQS